MGVVNKAVAFRRTQEESLGWDCDGGCKHAQVLVCTQKIMFASRMIPHEILHVRFEFL